MKIQIFVMPAWIAGIQVCKDASGNIHVKLDSSTTCWNDAIEGFCFKLIEVPPPRIFKGKRRTRSIRNILIKTFVLFVSAFVVKIDRRFPIVNTGVSPYASTFPTSFLRTLRSLRLVFPISDFYVTFVVSFFRFIAQ